MAAATICTTCAGVDCWLSCHLHAKEVGALAAIKLSRLMGATHMVKKTAEKTGKSRNAKPFVERTTLLMAKIAKLGERLERHASRDSTDKLAGNFASALQTVAESGVKFLAGKPPDWRPAGSPTSSAVRGWEVGNTCRLVKEYAFMFPGLKADKEYTVTEVKKLGEGRGSKTFLRLNDADKTFVQGAQVEK